MKPQSIIPAAPSVLPGEPENRVVNPFSPKIDFQKYNADSAVLLREHTNQKWLRLSLDASLTQLSASGADNRELRGARRLIETLLDIGEKDTPVGKLPPIKLETYDT
jgi:hypothetical protein